MTGRIDGAIGALKTVGRILLVQTLLTAAAAGGVWAWLGYFEARSLFVGGMICLLPNVFLAARLFAPGAADDPRRILRGAYVGEAGKLVLTALFFAAAFIALKPLHAGLLFAGYILAQTVFWVALVIENEQPDLHN